MGGFPALRLTQLTPMYMSTFTDVPQASEEQTSKLLPDPFERKKFGTKILGILFLKLEFSAFLVSMRDQDTVFTNRCSAV